MSLLKEIRKKWKPRAPHAHKGDFGKIFILAGATGMSGAAYLTGMAALRSGAGLVILGVPQVVYPILARRSAELMVHPFPSLPQGSLAFQGLERILKFSRDADVLAVGPGLSRNPSTQSLIRTFLKKTRQALVLDADGLNALAGHRSAFSSLRGRAVLTPHPGEFIRLFGGKLSGQDSARKARALQAAQQAGCIVVLKGYRTVVSDGRKTYVNTTGNPGMATAGSGDILTGVIVALLGQGFSLWDASCFGVYLHGLAGDLAAKQTGEISLTASDILQSLAPAFQKVLGKRSSIRLRTPRVSQAPREL